MHRLDQAEDEVKPILILMKTLVLTTWSDRPSVLSPSSFFLLSTSMCWQPWLVDHHNLVIAFLLPFLHLEGVNVNGLLASGHGRSSSPSLPPGGQELFCNAVIFWGHGLNSDTMLWMLIAIAHSLLSNTSWKKHLKEQFTLNCTAIILTTFQTIQLMLQQLEVAPVTFLSCHILGNGTSDHWNKNGNRFL